MKSDRENEEEEASRISLPGYLLSFATGHKIHMHTDMTKSQTKITTITILL